MAHDTSVTRRTFYVILLGIYAVMVGLITLAPITGSLSTAPSWIPLAQIWYLLTSPQEAFYTSIGQVAGNVALFVPLGWLLPAIWKQLRSASRTGAVAATCSIGIELYQLLALTGRSPATDDVLLNTAGAVLGTGMFLAARSA